VLDVQESKLKESVSNNEGKALRIVLKHSASGAAW